MPYDLTPSYVPALPTASESGLDPRGVLVLRLASIGCTKTEVAKVLGVTVLQLGRLLDTNAILRGAYERGKVDLRVQLRRRQLEVAFSERNDAGRMLQWLGAQLLGQTEKHSVAHAIEQRAAELESLPLDQLRARALAIVEADARERDGTEAA